MSKTSDELNSEIASISVPIGKFESPVWNDFLSTAHSLIRGQRQQDYGDKKKNFSDIAGMWSILLGKTITSDQVVQCMIALKLARLIKSPNHKDSYIDIAGYVGCAEDLFDPEEWK